MLDETAKQWLKELLSTNVYFDEPMARHTSLGIGGPADALVEPQTQLQLKTLLEWAVHNNIPYTVIGSGTNLLVRDGGIRGLTIRPAHLAVEIHWQIHSRSVALKAGAGVPTRRLCALALRRGWQGINFALGIPGSLGGAVWMNAGTRLGSMGDIVEAISILSCEGKIMRLAKEQIDFGFRALHLPVPSLSGEQGQPIVLNAELALALSDSKQLRQEAQSIMRKRIKMQPVWEPSAGCFFRNPGPHMPAGRLIDEAGLKGVAVGDACVSQRHANFIVNNGQATAAQVLKLKAQVEAAVWRKFKIKLQPEVRIVGQDT